MIASYDLSFCKAEIHKDYILTIMKEGITVMPKYNDLLLLGKDMFYKNKPFVYISHRIHSYSVDPAIHIEMAKIPNLVGVAVISDDPKQEMQIQIEQSFFKKEIKLFCSIKHALAWKDKIIQKAQLQK